MFFNLSTPERREIDDHTAKLIVGLIAVFLAAATNFIAGGDLGSISESYHRGGLARDLFVGCLFAIAAFLLSYNGLSTRQMVLSKFACVAAIGVAIFPCACVYGCESREPLQLHGFSAAVMFSVLAFFCYTFYDRAKNKGHAEAILRSRIYATCGVFIIGSILVLAFDNFSNCLISSSIENLIFICEEIGLVAFGVAWLTASRALPVLTTKEERLIPFGFISGVDAI